MRPRFSPLPTGWTRLFHWALLSLAIFLPGWLTLPEYGVTYDEPIYIEDSFRVREWLHRPIAEIFSPEQVARAWRAPSRNVHPAAIIWLDTLAQEWVFWEDDPYLQSRTLGLVAYAAVLALFGLWFCRWRFAPACLFAVLSALQPRLFAHSHFATPDLLLITAFLACVVVLDATLATRFFWLGGVLAGIACAVKFTALLLLVPLLLLLTWFWRESRRVRLARIAVILAVAAATFWVVNPGWWSGPVARAQEFVRISTTRADWAPYSVYFWGKLYSFRGPFYSPAVILLITTPLLHLGLAAAGAASLWGRRKESFGLRPAAALCFTLWPVLLMMWPGSPTNDMERYLLPALPFLTGLAVLGGLRILELRPVRFEDWSAAGKRFIGLALVLALLAGEAAWGGLSCHPAGLSYFNGLIGGLPGAHRIGFEDTYWWEVFNDRVLAELNRRCRGEAVYFPMAPTDLYFRHMIRQGKLEFHPVSDPGRAQFVLVYGRPSVRFWEERLDWLRESAELRWERTLQGIPLIRLYSIRPASALRPLRPGAAAAPPRPQQDHSRAGQAHARHDLQAQ